MLSGTKKVQGADEFHHDVDEASEESEFLSALNASLQSFVHKTLKDEQIECIHEIACHGRDVFTTDGIRQ